MKKKIVNLNALQAAERQEYENYRVDKNKEIEDLLNKFEEFQNEYNDLNKKYAELKAQNEEILQN